MHGDHSLYGRSRGVAAMKADRLRLKADNCDLHIQMKQLYCTLGDKEAELRDFIRNYKQRRENTDDTIKKVSNCSSTTSFLLFLLLISILSG